MTVPTGTATPWQQLDQEEEASFSTPLFLVYWRSGDIPGNADLLAEQLRVDGVASSLGPALGAAADAVLYQGFIGTDDDGQDRFAINEAGETQSGDFLNDVRRCVYATVSVKGL